MNLDRWDHEVSLVQLELLVGEEDVVSEVHLVLQDLVGNQDLQEEEECLAMMVQLVPKGKVVIGVQLVLLDPREKWAILVDQVHLVCKVLEVHPVAMEHVDKEDLQAEEESLVVMAKMVKLDLRVCKVSLDLQVPWVTKDPLESLAKMEGLVPLAILDPEEILEKMDHLANLDPQDQLDQWANEGLLVHPELVDSRVCQVRLAKLANLVKMEWLVYLVSLV